MSKTIYSMILVQKTQLVKYTIIIFIYLTFIFNCNQYISAFDEIENENTESAFSVLDEDIYKSTNSDLDITKQSIIQGELESFNLAKIRILDYNTGHSSNKELKLEENLELTEGSFINLKECKKDIKYTLNPVSMAFISVTNHGQIIYEGWIFSKNTSIALPKIDDGLIYLTGCDNQVINKEEVNK